jgi:hypothetical protein
MHYNYILPIPAGWKKIQTFISETNGYLIKPRLIRKTSDHLQNQWLSSKPMVIFKTNGYLQNQWLVAKSTASAKNLGLSVKPTISFKTNGYF